MIGRTLAHYRIEAALGAGGMGEVYRATDTRLGRDEALFDRVATGALVATYAPAPDGKRFFTFREPQATGAGVSVALDLGFARRLEAAATTAGRAP